MVPPTARARRHPKWPKAWEMDWDLCQARATDMLRVQNLPTKFRSSEVVEAALGEEYEENKAPMKLSVNFDVEQLPHSKRSPEESGSCLACGNCLAGCPYAAKNSTDRTYLATAVKAGCTIKTDCEVQYVVKNQDDMGKEGGTFEKRTRRQWLVFVNEFDYIETDIVVLSAGVFGTAQILFRSQMRGLQVSQKLGLELSCNGNYVAYLAESPAPLNATGLNRKQFPNVAFGERPGPSISSSHTSSLGFTIQSAVTPAAYPSLLFKGIATYAPQTGPHPISRLLKHSLGLSRGQEMVLNVIGHDSCDGRLEFDKERNVVSLRPPHDPLLPRKVEALERLAGKLGGVLFLSRFTSTSAHHLGGCNASLDSSSGVCDPEGRVFDTSAPRGGTHAGLYVCDASLVPCSVGINPCLTIATVAEHMSRSVVMDNLKNMGNFLGKNLEDRHIRYFSENIDILETKKRGESVVSTREVMRGRIGGMPCTALLKLRFGVDLRGRVGGFVECRGVEIERMHILHGVVDLCKTDPRTPYTQYMHYRLLIAATSGSRYVLEGTKTMNPYLLALYAWRESTTLNVTLRNISSKTTDDDTTSLTGKLHVSLFELLRSLCAFNGRSKFKFMCLFTRSLFQTYILQTPRGGPTNFTPAGSGREPYPKCTTHEFTTEDAIRIRCEHWQCGRETGTLKGEKRKYPALLLNGYATESYCLPTEQTDLVRTLVRDGHDVWLLRARMHFSIASNHFSVDDIGRFDIPAAIDKMVEFYGEPVKVHVVAHCLGGLAIHIAIMGGHVSAKCIASLTCTNSSMFYKLTAASRVKMWLPLIPMSMAVLGKDTILPMLRESATSQRHRLLKQIARLIPRCQRCLCDECEVLSGIFGNAYWHENISDAMHHWMTKENLPRLPMAAFPHLRKICRAGFIVDGDGKNSYLIYPDRMAVPTLYISGGRTLLVTPETSFLANKYMKMHQSGYRHERVVVEGFGHSDLMIGERSSEVVFPHITKHVEAAEEEMGGCVGGRRDVKEALGWSVDPYGDEGNLGSWVFFGLINVVFIVFVLKLFFF